MDIFVIIAIVGALLLIAALVFFVVLVSAIKSDDKRCLPTSPDTPTSTMSRRVLGTYARRATQPTRTARARVVI